MTRKRLALTALLAAGAIALAGCKVEFRSITGSATANPPVVGAKVLFSMAGSGACPSATTAVRGAFKASVANAGDWLVTVSGGKLDDNGDGKGDRAFGGRLYTVLRKDGPTGIVASTLTTLALRTGLYLTQLTDPTAIVPTEKDLAAATETVKTCLGFGLPFDPFADPAVVTSSIASDADAVARAQNHRLANDAAVAIISANLAEILVPGGVAADSAVFNDWLDAVAADLTDGVWDGKTANGVASPAILTNLGAAIGTGGDFCETVASYTTGSVTFAAVKAAMSKEAAKLTGFSAALLSDTAPAGFTGKAMANAVRIEAASTYATGVFADGAAEIPAYDPATKRLFVINGSDAAIDVISVADPDHVTKVFSIDITPYGKAANSVAVKNGVVAAAVENIDKQQNGQAVFFDADGNLLGQTGAGALPDMVVFTPDGTKVLLANEGEPSDDYTVDPEGSVTIVDISAGAANPVTATASFAPFVGREDSLRAQGIRIFGPGATAAQDFEPEYIAVSPDSATAYVTLQENNAIAVIDIATATVTSILPLGFKDWSLAGNGLDPSDKDGGIHIAHWPVFGMYQPDEMEAYTTGGETYLIMANEGDSRDYGGFSEEARVKNLTLDPTAFPNASDLKKDSRIGRLKVTSTLGNGASGYTALYAFGARSFSIRKTDGSLVYDSGSDFENIVAALFPDYFNCNEDSNTKDDRSDDKGPEPEGVTVGMIDGRAYAFIGLEREGGVMVYDVTSPARPVFMQYLNNRDFTRDPASGLAGDLAPEGLVFINKADSPVDVPLLAVANEVSGTTTVYRVIRY